MRIDARSKEIVSLLETGRYTLQEVGGIYGISRERIRQIYKKSTGESSNHRSIYLKEKGIMDRILRSQQVKLLCAGCGIKVRYREGANKKKYCPACSYLSVHKARAMSKTRICLNCSNPFHPASNWRFPSQRARAAFCGNLCYYDCKHQAKLLREYYQGISNNP